MRITLALACIMLLLPAAIAQEDKLSANYIMNGCRSYLRDGDHPNRRDNWIMVSGACFGMVAGLMNASAALEEPYRFCPPNPITISQGIRVVVTYIDNIPYRAHEPFLQLTLEALRKAWPC